MKIYNINPVTKPRMTQRDKFARRDCVVRYFAYKREVCAQGLVLPSGCWHVVFVLPMPRSWSRKKCAEYYGMPHQQTPDKDNLEKGLLDAIYDNDCMVWDGRVSKIWGDRGQIIVLKINHSNFFSLFRGSSRGGYGLEGRESSDSE